MELTQIDQSATYDCLLVIRSNHGPISYDVRDIVVISVENRKVFHPMYAPTKGFNAPRIL